VKHVLLGVLGLALLTGCVARPAPIDDNTPPTTSRPAPPECPAEGVEISVAGTDAAMGLRTMSLELVNCGTSPYTVRGYPSVRLFDEDREPIEVAVGPGSNGVATVPAFDVPPQEVTLQPGEKAISGLLWRNLVTDSTVTATTAVHMDAAVLEGKPWQQVPMTVPDEVNGTRTTEIDLGNTGKLGVQAWTKTTP
jgi:Protein of unknown function (DUF4232)